ncbi:MAG TPA: energy transducer TonB [Chthoniobacterales bacterium]|nr:energy transducer TonB [Chthoniobacterales bacterium]
MAGPLLYRPPPKWQTWAAVGGALAIHFAAVAIASIHPQETIEDLSQIPEAVVELTIDQPPTPEPPPPDELPPPPPPEAIPEEKPEFVEEKPTPPPKRPPSTKPVAPIARPAAVGNPGPAPTGKAAMTFKPPIAYPYEARRSKTTGSGVILVSVGSGGEVTDASMGQSTGSPILDNAATTAFRRARFKPGTVPKVKIPITFNLTGASY